MAQANVPKFGNWENEGNDVPYTIYFDKARKTKGGKMINPNDPQENPDMFRNFAPSPPPPTRPLSANSTSDPKTRPEKPVILRREEGDNRKFTNSPARSSEIASNESSHQNYGGRGMKFTRPARTSGGSEHSVDRSPLHPHYQEGKNSYDSSHGKNSYDGGHGNPPKTRPKAVTRGVESPDRGAAVPRFGDWNENDPESGEKFTGIFNQVREEKYTGPRNVSTTPRHPSSVTQNQTTKKKTKKCCFPWPWW